MYINIYECLVCDHSWEDESECMNNDRCGGCDEEIRPSVSVESETGERIVHN